MNQQIMHAIGTQKWLKLQLTSRWRYRQLTVQDV